MSVTLPEWSLWVAAAVALLIVCEVAFKAEPGGYVPDVVTPVLGCLVFLAGLVVLLGLAIARLLWL